MMPVVRDLQSDILSGLSPQEREAFLELASKVLGPSPTADLEKTAGA